MASCFNNANNASFVCLNDDLKLPDWAQPGSCVYLYDQQLNRANSQCAHFEIGITFAIFLASIAANTVAVNRFYRHRTRPTFLLLIFCHTVFNIATTSLATIASLARFFDNWYIDGSFGCVVVHAGRCSLMTMTLLLLALMSYERRVAVFNCHSSRSSTWLSSWFKVFCALTTLALYNFALWFYPFLHLGISRTFQVPTTSSAPPVLVCALILTTKQQHHTIMATTLTIFGLIVPLIFSTLNFLSVWSFVRVDATSHFSSQHKNKGECARQLRLISREVRLVKVAGLATVVFLACSAPSQALMIYLSLETSNYRDLPSCAFLVTNWCTLLGATCNPLLLSLLLKNVPSTSTNNNNDNSRQKKLRFQLPFSNNTEMAEIPKIVINTTTTSSLTSNNVAKLSSQL